MTKLSGKLQKVAKIPTSESSKNMSTMRPKIRGKYMLILSIFSIRQPKFVAKLQPFVNWHTVL